MKRGQFGQDVAGVVAELFKSSNEVVLYVARVADLVLRSPVSVQPTSGLPLVHNVLGELGERHVTYTRSTD